MKVSDSIEPRYDAFKLRHLDHKGELIHYVGTPVTIAEIEARLVKNSVTHVWLDGEWQKVERRRDDT